MPVFTGIQLKSLFIFKQSYIVHQHTNFSAHIKHINQYSMPAIFQTAKKKLSAKEGNKENIYNQAFSRNIQLLRSYFQHLSRIQQNKNFLLDFI